MTADEKNLWDYVEDESDTLLLTIAGNVERDGFDKLSSGPAMAEMVALKIMSAAIVKMLAMVTEETGNCDLATAYMQMVPMHVELIKVYTFRALERSQR